jgi:2-phospho-L-lactate transferase/gluconeogenesis factor (CofD/UPF0052 family)/hydroxymethylpyrimidine pyrophosphatase-like HAD family hydrolase
MKCVILSGGSGNDSLIKGLVDLYPQMDIKVVVNAYDDGKSTGVCRKITNTLGVSDIRKNHYRMYEAKSSFIDNGLSSFYNNRYDLDMRDRKSYVGFLLNEFGLPFLCKYSDRFFDSIQKDETFDFKSFNIANIVYSQMYKELGYDYTNAFFCSLLGIDDFVILNSYDNVTLKAVAKGRITLESEAEIVEYCNAKSPILGVEYTNSERSLNHKALDAIVNADMIVMSSGTFWSSLYPTLEYGNLYKHINDSKAKKYWIINNEEDKDALGVGSNDFIATLEYLGLNLEDFIIIQNEDACNLLKQANTKYRIVRGHLGNDKGKHNPSRLAKFLMKKHYSLHACYDSIFIDFDDTLWSRDSNTSRELKKISVENINLLSKIREAQVVTGNSYESVKDVLSNIENIVWADANSVAYHRGRVCNMVESNIFSEKDMVTISTYLNTEVLCGDMKLSTNNRFFPTFLKIKPIKDTLVRKILCEKVNEFLDKYMGDAMAICSGRTTIDVVKRSNSKAQVFDKVSPKGNSLYIGDEIDEGNDKEIAKKCTHCIEVKDVYETNLILRLLIDDSYGKGVWHNC